METETAIDETLIQMGAKPGFPASVEDLLTEAQADRQRRAERWIDPDNADLVRRRAVVVAAISVLRMSWSEERVRDYLEEIDDHFWSGRDAVVLAMLNIVEPEQLGRYLRAVYGSPLEEVDADEARARAVRYSEIEQLEARGLARWPWPYSRPREIACRRTGFVYMEPLALDAFHEIREAAGSKIDITSAYRSPKHNRSIPGAAKRSLHMRGRAMDLSMVGHDPDVVIGAAVGQPLVELGEYPDPSRNFLHVAVGHGEMRHWGEDGAYFPRGEPIYADEQTREDPAKAPAKSTTAAAVTAGGGIFGVAAYEWFIGLLRDFQDLVVMVGERYALPLAAALGLVALWEYRTVIWKRIARSLDWQ